MAHALDITGIEDRFENRQACREDASAIWLDAIEVELFHLTSLEYFAFQQGQALGVYFACAKARRLNGQADGLDRAGCAHRIFPAQAAQSMLYAHDLQPRRRVGLGVTRRGDLAVLEETLGKADAAHLQAFAQQWFEALADDELGAAAANIGNQALARGVCDAVRHTEVDQARFFAPRDDLHRVAENFFGAADRFATVARLTQGIS